MCNEYVKYVRNGWWMSRVETNVVGRRNEKGRGSEGGGRGIYVHPREL